MNRNSEAIILFCSFLGVRDDIRPLSSTEWSHLATRLMDRKLQPQNLFDFAPEDWETCLGCTAEERQRYQRLLDRAGSLRFKITRYEDMGIRMITRADSEYPARLKKALRNACPPLFYCAGNPALLVRPALGLRAPKEMDDRCGQALDRLIDGMPSDLSALITGGTEGQEQYAAANAIQSGRSVTDFMTDSMFVRMRDHILVRQIREGQRLLLSLMPPEQESGSEDMIRQKYDCVFGCAEWTAELDASGNLAKHS